MKQRETTVLLGLLIVISFSLGHACLNLNDFWTEPIITWIAIVLPTGKASSDICRGPFSPFKKVVSFKDRTWLSVSGDDPKNGLPTEINREGYFHSISYKIQFLKFPDPR